jgi:hypothetical protein
MWATAKRMPSRKAAKVQLEGPVPHLEGYFDDVSVVSDDLGAEVRPVEVQPVQGSRGRRRHRR